MDASFDTLTIGLILGIGILSLAYFSILLGFSKNLNACWLLAVALYLGFFCLPLIYLRTDFPLSIIMLFGCLAVLSVALLKRGTFKPLFDDRGFRASLLFLVFTTASLLWTPNVNYGLTKLGIFVVVGLGFGLLIYVVMSSYKRFSWLPLLFVGLVYNIAVMIFGDWESSRATFMGQNPIWITRLSFISITIGLLAINENKYLRLFVVATGLFVCYIGESRGPLIAFVLAWFIGGVIWHILYRRNVYLKYILAGFSITIIGIIFGLFLAGFGLIESETRYATLLSDEVLLADPNVVARLDLMKNAIHTFWSHPIGGIGIGGYAVSDRSYPHNIILEIMCELGIIGLTLWLIMIWHMWKSARKSIVFRILFLQTLIYAFASGDLAGNIEYVVIGFAAMAFLWVQSQGVTFARSPCTSQISCYSQGLKNFPPWASEC